MVEWRAVVGFEGFYEVSDDGQVRSLDHEGPGGRGGMRIYKGRVRKQKANSLGYMVVNLSAPGSKTVTKRVHQLVAESFHGPVPDGMVVCHNDGDQANNAVGNLRYDTPGSNLRDKRRHGTDHNVNKTHCPQGHRYAASNTYTYTREGRTSRSCRTCMIARAKSRRLLSIGTEGDRR